MTREADQAAAARIAERVRTDGGLRGGWFEVRALMAEFDVDRYSPDAQERMSAALTQQGLALDRPLGELTRSDTVVLTLNHTPGDARETRLLDEVLTTRTLDGVRWFDILDSRGIDPAELRQALQDHCHGQLTDEAIADLLSPDPRPRIKRYGERPEVRCVSAFALRAEESDEGVDPDSDSKAGVLVFEPVEFLVGRDWLITCWHESEVYRGVRRIRESAPTQRAALIAEVERRWPTSGFSSAGDLALLLFSELVLTHAPAYRQLYVWLEEWEMDFYRRADRIDRDTLLEVRALGAVLRDWLSPLNPPGKREDVEKLWFPGITGTPEQGAYELAVRVDDRIDSALKQLRALAETLRGAYDLLQLRERERERERDDRFQRGIAVGGSAILIPTLVAGIMGANTWVPGQAGPESPKWAFLVLVAIVVASGALAWAVIHRLQRRDERH